METYAKTTAPNKNIIGQKLNDYGSVGPNSTHTPIIQGFIDDFGYQLKENNEILYEIEEKLHIILNKQEPITKDTGDFNNGLGHFDLISLLKDKLNVFNNQVIKLRGLRNHLNEIA